MHRPRTILPLLLLAACGRPEPVRIALTPEPWARSLVIALSRDNAVLTRLTALDIAAETRADLLPSIPDLDADDAAEITVLAYAEPLADHGLTAGELGASLPTNDPMAVPLHLPREILTYTIARGAAVESVRADLPPLLRDYRLRKPPARCARFQATTYNVDSPGSSNFNVPIDDRHVVIGLRAGELIKVSVTGSITPYRSVPADFPTGAAARDERGRHWFAGESGAVWRGVLTDDLSGIRPLTTAPSRGNIHWIAVGGDEIYTLTSRGAFEHWDGTRWRLLHTFPFFAGQDLRGGVVRLGPGHGIAGFASSPSVVRDRSGQVAEERPSDASPEGITALAQIEGVGLVVTNAIGAFFVEQGGAWTALPGADTGLPRDVIVPFEGGFFYTGVGGLVGTWTRDAGFCPLEKLAVGSSRYVVQLGDTLILAGPKAELRDRPTLTFLKRLP